MEFDIEKNNIQNAEDYSKDELDIAYDFAKLVHKELGEFCKALVLFGSVARNRSKRVENAQKGGIEGTVEGKEHDIDVLIVVDDVAHKLTKELVQTYRIIIEKLVREVSERLHVITLKFTSFWEYARSGDPIGVNVLRDGVPIIDTGFFEPLQMLLRRGRVRPTPESVWSYFNKAPMTLKNSQRHVMQAVIDLYWAVIDSAHAALMKLNEVPPSPEHVSDMIKDKLIKPGAVEPKYAKTMKKFYDLMKGIEHGDIQEMSGSKYDSLYKEAEGFVEEMEKFINSR